MPLYIQKNENNFAIKSAQGYFNKICAIRSQMYKIHKGRCIFLVEKDPETYCTWVIYRVTHVVH